MKKIYILTAVFALLTLSLNAQDLKVDQFGKVVQPKAQAGKVNAPNRAATQVTVCEGTSTNYYVPFYGLYFDDNYQIDQMIYPESLLTNLVGKTITSVTFYANSNFSSNIGSGKFTFKIGTTTNQTTFSNPITRITTGMTAVATNMTMSNCISGSQLIIDFSDNPFTYQGGNLVLDYELTTLASGYNSTAFYGQNNHTSASFYSRSTSNSTNSYGVYSNSSIANFLPKVTFGAEDASPKIEVSPTTLTINDSGTNNTFTVQGSNLGSDNVGVTVPDGSGFTRTTDDQYWGFVNNNGSVSGTATIGYEGRDLSASTTVSVGNNLVSTTVAVTYVPDLYIYSDGGVTPWNFSANPAVAMTNQGNGIYTATLQDIPNNSHILFGRASGLTYNWENDDNRLFIGAVTDGGDWGYGDNTTGNLDTDPRDDSPVKYHPILIPEGGTYTITINANDYTFTIEKLILPPPENVVATADSENQKATVTWDAPSNLPSKSVTEDFEDTSVFPPFTTGGVTATTHTGAFGEWTLYDATGGCVVYGSKQLNYEHESEPHAWFVFAPSGATADQEYPNAVAHDCYSGAQYLESICPQSSTTAAGVSDHWLISPELSGNAQTISFYVSEMTTQYGDETYEIWVSTTDNDPSSFTQLGSTYNVSLDTWADQSVQLPAGTKYFAIRHTSNDIFGLLIDDVTYERVINPISYKIYLDGEYVATVPSTTDPLSYDFGTLAAGTHIASVSAVYEGGIESAATPSNEFTIVAKTPTPTITHTETPAGVVITATGEGHVTLVVDGITYEGEGSVSATVVRSPEEREVTATATAQASGALPSDKAEEDITIPALTTDPTEMAEGLLRLHLLMVDQMFEDIPDDNSHPDRYNYVLRYEPNGPTGSGVKESSTVHVDIQKADCEVTGYYSLKQIDGDTIIGLDHKQGITMDVVTADVAYNLSNNNDMLYEYLLQGATTRVPEYQEDFLTKLRKSQNFTYFEMWEKSPNKGQEYPNGEHHYLDSLMIGNYGSTFRSYAPSVSTDGIQRRYYEDDGFDNTYGAPIWKTAVGEVKMSEEEAPIAERQTNQWNSVNWTDKDAQGNDAPASLFILDNIWATAKLPHTQIATVKYEPYMFRVFVQSNNGLLRPYKVVPQGEGQYDGEHLDAVDRDLTEADVKGPKCVWSGYLQFDEDGEVIGDLPNGVEVQPGTDDGGQKTFTYHKSKVDRQGGSNATLPQPSEWDKDPNNAMFGALDALAISGYDAQGKPILRNDITEDDLKIFVRFYYVVKGMADGWTPGTRGQGDDPAGYGSESGSSSPGIATSVNEIRYHGEAVETIYYNVQGMSSDRPFEGVNIVVTRYSDGATVVSKVVK